MLGELFAAVEREAEERVAPFREAVRARRAYREAKAAAFLDFLAAQAERNLPTFKRHYAEARARHGLTP